MSRSPSFGFTIIEVLITTALFVVLVVGIVQLYVVFGRMVSFESLSIGSSLSASAIIDAARTAGLEADHIVASHAFSGVTYTTGTTTAVFELPAIDASGAPLTNTYDYVGIYATGTSAYSITDAAAGSARLSGTKVLTNALTALTFTYNQSDVTLATSTTVDATTTASVIGQATDMHIRENIYLRNL